MITENTLISELIKEEPGAIDLLAAEGMRCVGCSSVEGETFAEACREHGLDPILEMRKMNLRLYGKIC